MSNVSIAAPNRFDGATLSDPYWTTGLPLDYLLTRQISQVARSLFTTARFYAAFSSPIEVSNAGLVGHNLSTTGQWRLRGFATDPRPVLRADFTLGAVPSWLTFARSGAAYYFGSNGLLQSAASGVPRFDYAAGVCRGLLLEPDATNQLLHCRDLTQAAWSATTTTRAKTATGIDGAANSATTLTATGATATVTQAYNITANNYVLSFYARRVSGSGNVKPIINGAAGSAIAITSTWTRFSTTTFTNISTAGVQIATSGDVIEIDFVQLELGIDPTSPILTTSASASRGTDTLTNTLATAGASSIVAAGSLMVKGALSSRPQASNQIGIGIRNSTNNFVGAYIPSTGVMTARMVNAGTTQADLTAATLTPGSAIAVAMSWATNDVRSSTSGGTAQADTSATVPTLTEFSLGSYNHNGVEGGLWLQELALYAGTRVNADLVSLSGAAGENVAAYDSALTNAWPAAWVSGTTAEQRAGVRGVAEIRPGSPQTYQWWRIDMVDTANTKSYLQLGRVVFSSAWQPITNMSYGVQMRYVPRADTVVTKSGAKYFADNPRPREARLAMEWQTEAEAMLHSFELQRQLGTTGEVLFSYDPADTLYQPMRTFLAHMTELGAIAQPLPGVWTCSYQLEELL